MGKILKRYLMPHPPIIIPQIGQGEEEKVRHTIDALKEVSREIKKLSPKTILLITPHGPLFEGAIAVSDVGNIRGDFGKFGRPDIEVKKQVNEKLTKRIIENVLDKHILIAPIDNDSKEKYGIDVELDHGALVPLYYIDEEYKDYDVVHITYGLLPKEELYNVGDIIKRTVEELDESVVVVASGDLSHRLKETGPYEFSKSGAVFDTEILSLLKNGEARDVFDMDPKLIEEAGECALRSIYILLGTLDSCEFRGELLSYEGPFGVGYGVMRFEVDGESVSLKKSLSTDKEKEIPKESDDPFVKLARESVYYFLKHGKYISVPLDLPKEMLTERRGVFVTFKMDGELRGCIGTISPVTGSIAEEIIRNSVEAATRDPRFYPITLEEYPYLDVSVDELMDAEPAEFEELDPKNYGVIVRTSRKSGLLLPDLEGVDTSREQVDIALRKAGITKNEDYKLEKFKVIRHK